MPPSPDDFLGLIVHGRFRSTGSGAPLPRLPDEAPVSYELVRCIGAGKFAWVFEAVVRAGPPEPRVAVKLLHRDDHQANLRFQREIKVLQQISRHPHVVGYRGHGEVQRAGVTRPWLALEFIDGATLGKLLASRRPFPVDTACRLMIQLCDGFEELHRLGLTHRDITPDNIMLSRVDQAIRLMDFGLVQDSQGLLQLYEQADILHGSDFHEDLDAGLIAGTPEYMAPEQILDPNEPNHARQHTDTPADVFALGAIFYELLAGKRLFPWEAGARGQEGREALLAYFDWRTAFDEASLTAPPGVDAALWSIVHKALSHTPRARQRDAAELAADIRFYRETGQGIVEEDVSSTLAATFDPAAFGTLVGQLGLDGLVASARSAQAHPTSAPSAHAHPTSAPAAPSASEALSRPLTRPHTRARPAPAPRPRPSPWLIGGIALVVVALGVGLALLMKPA